MACFILYDFKKVLALIAFFYALNGLLLYFAIDITYMQIMSYREPKTIKTDIYCPKDWVKIGKRCHFFGKDKMNYTSTVRLCADLKADLTIFDDENDAKIFATMFRSTWLGMTGDDWPSWHQGNELLFPNDPSDHLAYRNGEIRATRIETKLELGCSRAICPPKYILGSTLCYRYIERPLSLYEANMICRDDGARIPSPETIIRNVGPYWTNRCYTSFPAFSTNGIDYLEHRSLTIYMPPICTVRLPNGNVTYKYEINRNSLLCVKNFK